jgi:diguanylate cyclase (GGDEF)-like protein
VNGVEGPSAPERHTARGDHALTRIEDRLMAGLRRAQGARALVRASIVIAASLLALAIDWVTGADTSAMFEYAIAAAVAAWLCVMSRAALVVAAMLVLSTVLTAIVDDPLPDWQLWANSALRAATLLLILVVVASLRRHIERAEFVAHVDPLTGSWSRGALLDGLELSVHQAHRSGAQLSVLYLDLDRLKSVNDTLGHAAGDEVIRRFAAVVMRHARRSDVFGRVGGDEFLVICPDTDGQAAHRLAERILVDPDLPDVSIGVAELAPGRTSAQLLAEADAAMYRAKAR